MFIWNSARPASHERAPKQLRICFKFTKNINNFVNRNEIYVQITAAESYGNDSSLKASHHSCGSYHHSHSYAEKFCVKRRVSVE